MAKNGAIVMMIRWTTMRIMILMKRQVTTMIMIMMTAISDYHNVNE